jgi:hypothetical protein
MPDYMKLEDYLQSCRYSNLCSTVEFLETDHANECLKDRRDLRYRLTYGDGMVYHLITLRKNEDMKDLIIVKQKSRDVALVYNLIKFPHDLVLMQFYADADGPVDDWNTGLRARAHTLKTCADFLMLNFPREANWKNTSLIVYTRFNQFKEVPLKEADK